MPVCTTCYHVYDFVSEMLQQLITAEPEAAEPEECENEVGEVEAEVSIQDQQQQRLTQSNHFTVSAEPL